MFIISVVTCSVCAVLFSNSVWREKEVGVLAQEKVAFIPEPGTKQVKIFWINSLCSLQSLESSFTGVTSSMAFRGIRTGNMQLRGQRVLVLTLQRLMLVKLQREWDAAMKLNIALALLYAPAVLRLIWPFLQWDLPWFETELRSVWRLSGMVSNTSCHLWISRWSSKINRSSPEALQSIKHTAVKRRQ